jgi:hypothetical protein
VASLVAAAIRSQKGGPMSELQTHLGLTARTVIELSENDAVDKALAEQLCRRGRDIAASHPMKSRALAIAMVGVLAMPFLGLIPDSETKLERLQALIENQRAANDGSAVFAVDTSGLQVLMKNPGAQKDPVEQAVVENLAQLHNTYRDWVEGNEELMGSLVLKVNIDGSGAVTRVEPSASKLNDTKFVPTIVADVRSWKIPQDGGAEIIVPLLFIPKGMDAQTVVQWERTVRGPQASSPLPEFAKRPAPSIQPATWVTPLPNVQAAPQLGAVQAAAPLPAVKAVVAPVAKAKVDAKPVIFVKANRQLALRDHPRYSANAVREIDDQTRLSIVERRGDWLKVRLADGSSTGFVRKEYVSEPENG